MTHQTYHVGDRVLVLLGHVGATVFAAYPDGDDLIAVTLDTGGVLALGLAEVQRMRTA